MRAAAEAIDATIGYLLPSSRVNRRYIAPGAEHSTGVYGPHPVSIRNARLTPDPMTLERNGFCLVPHRSAVRDFHDRAAVERIYPDEVSAAVRELTGADLVVPMGGMWRSAKVDGTKTQPPAAEAHVDFETHTARRIAERFYELGAPHGPGYSRFIGFSFWRTFSPPPQDYPLALCDFRTVAADEGVANVKVDVAKLLVGDALLAPIPGEDALDAATVFRFNPAHRWYYYPDMTPDEAIFITLHDSDHSRAWRAPHTAFHDARLPDAHCRESYEFRGVAYFR